MNPETEKKIREAATGKGEILIVETDIEGCEVAAFRVPTTLEWSRYTIAQRGTKEEKAGAGKPLVICCCVYPAAQAFETAIDGHPGLVETYLDSLVEHAGANRSKKVSKL